MTELTEALAALLETPPRSLVAGTLLESGVADGFVTVPGPSGTLTVAFNPRGISAVAPGADPDRFAKEFVERMDRPVFPVVDMPVDLRRPLDRALDSGRLGGLRVDWRGQTDFQQTVLGTVARIPPGEVRPYGWVARRVGKPSAYRAVGSAVAQNPVPVIVPCHRVVKSDGHVGSYRFGEAMKHLLLEHEGVSPGLLDEAADKGQVLVGNTRTGTACFITCTKARRVAESNRNWFGNSKAARLAGYEPCERCQPY